MPYLLNYWPTPLERVAIVRGQAGAKLRVGERFRLMSWNIQFGASRRYHFFYDGGPDVHAEWEVVQRTLDAQREMIFRAAPDILLLQEVDRDSARTSRIDQLPRLIDGLSFASWASTPYHRSRFVPVPLGRAIGRVDMHLATASRYEMTWARRRALPLLAEPLWRRAFNLKRAVLETAIQVEGLAQPLLVLNTHLSAFSRGDGTMARQVAAIMERLAFLDARGIPWVLAGDLNLLPPGDSPARLGAEAGYYADRENPILPLYSRYQSGVPAEEEARSPARFYTYLPFGAKVPDRRLDYVFVSDRLDLHGLRVMRDSSPSSDHLPLLLVASIKAAP
ncbi:MAG: endonuclease/exonuclease/phosphatase family protein [Polyangia bacterium]|mgnify:CR=1 FL=1|nr:endonuclease/exonuclease/phosphatase family protein [Polyangia bacterium]